MMALLIDPDKYEGDQLLDLINRINESHIDLLFVGGSLLTSGRLSDTIEKLKATCKQPVVIFPGSGLQINTQADAILFLSLLSGRNPQYLIGEHVVWAPHLKRSKLQALSTAYLLIDGGAETTASYISGTNPLPSDKPEIAMSTAIAGEMMGMSLVFLDAGSGAKKHVPFNVVESVRQNVDIPVIVGGGIRSVETAEKLFKSGADLIVVGNAIEGDLSFLDRLSTMMANLKAKATLS